LPGSWAIRNLRVTASLNTHTIGLEEAVFAPQWDTALALTWYIVYFQRKRLESGCVDWKLDPHAFKRDFDYVSFFLLYTSSWESSAKFLGLDWKGMFAWILMCTQWE